MVGDPSGRSEERNLLDERHARAQRRRHQGASSAGIARLRRGPTGRRWSTTATGPRDLALLDFLRDVGKHVTVNQMLAKESVQARMESEHGISFTEFSYMLLQANDFLLAARAPRLRAADRRLRPVGQHHRRRRPDPPARRRAPSTRSAWPLLTAADGTKFGKTHRRARVARPGQDVARTSSSSTGCSTDDAEVERFLLQFTLLPVDEIDAVVAAHDAAPERAAGPAGAGRRAHRARARRRRRAAAAEAAADVLFGGDPDAAPAAALEPLAAEVPDRRACPGRAAGRRRRWSTCWPRPGSPRRRARPAGCIDQGGVYGQRPSGADADGAVERRPTCSTAGFLLLRKGKRHVPPGRGRSRRLHAQVGDVAGDGR